MKSDKPLTPHEKERLIDQFAESEAHALIQVPGIAVFAPDDEKVIKNAMLKVAQFTLCVERGQTMATETNFSQGPHD